MDKHCYGTFTFIEIVQTSGWKVMIMRDKRVFRQHSNSLEKR